jgi:hypothetical protein
MAPSSLLPTQSSNDVERPTRLAKLFLEDGTVLTGRSFGAHKAVDGEVRFLVCFVVLLFVLSLLCFEMKEVELSLFLSLSLSFSLSLCSHLPP